MAWTALMTFTANTVLTAAQLNTYIGSGGNLSHTAPAVVTTAGDTVYATGANTLTRLAIGTAGSLLASTGTAPVWRTPAGDVATSAVTTATTYGDPNTSGTNGPSVSVTTGTRALVVFSCTMSNSTANARSMMGFEVTGASTLAADDDRAWGFQSQDANDPIWAGIPILLVAGLTAGSNTFTCKFKVTSGTGTFAARRLGVVPL